MVFNISCGKKRFTKYQEETTANPCKFEFAV